jgi:hypothetical protein
VALRHNNNAPSGRRHRIALELWTTEQTYIKALQQCTQMRKRLESLPKPILTPLEIKVCRLMFMSFMLAGWMPTLQPNQTIFSETETILLYATELESKLRQQLEHWHVDQTLAHVFTEIVHCLSLALTSRFTRLCAS